MRIDALLTGILSGTFSEAMRSLHVLYEYRVNRRVVCLVCAIKEAETKSTRYLVLILRDTVTNRWIGLRLPTVRKVLKFIGSKKLFASRKLNLSELGKL